MSAIQLIQVKMISKEITKSSGGTLLPDGQQNISNKMKSVFNAHPDLDNVHSKISLFHAEYMDLFLSNGKSIRLKLNLNLGSTFLCLFSSATEPFVLEVFLVFAVDALVI